MVVNIADGSKVRAVPDYDIPIDLEANVKVPYIVRDKVLMSPGIWNGNYYGSKQIQDGFEHTLWDDKAVRSLFLDHEDLRSREWIGEVINVRLLSDSTVIGDLVIVDKDTAVKLAYKAKMGISPKITGQEEGGEMKSFRFDNFSVVINPAVKTAYINNSQKEEAELARVTDFEKKREDLGLSISEFYAIPRDPPSSSKLPIFDAAHVRNALARFDQLVGVSEEEKSKAKSKITAAAKKFDIQITKEKLEDNTMTQEEEKAKVLEEESSGEKPKEEEEAKSEESKKDAPAKEESAEAKVEEAPAAPAAEANKVEEPAVAPAAEESSSEMAGHVKKEEEEEEEDKDKKKSVEMSEVEILSQMSQLLQHLIQKKTATNAAHGKLPPALVAAIEKKKKEEEALAEDDEEEKKEDKSKEMSQELKQKDDIIKELSQRVEKVEKYLNEPVRATSFGIASGVQVTEELSQEDSSITSVDKQFMSLLNSMRR